MIKKVCNKCGKDANTAVENDYHKVLGHLCPKHLKGYESKRGELREAFREGINDLEAEYGFIKEEYTQKSIKQETINKSDKVYTKL